MSISEVGLPESLRTDWAEMPGQTSTGCSSYIKFQNGSTNPALPNTPDQQYILSVSGTVGDPNKDHLVITGQASGPVSSKEALNIFPTGRCAFPNGIDVPQGQSIDFYDSSATPIKSLSIVTADTATPGVTFSQIGVQPGATLYFSQMGQSANTYITPAAYNVSNPGDQLVVGGSLYTRQLHLQNTAGAEVFGSATLVDGLVTVNTTAADINSIILLSRTAVNASTYLGELRIRQKNANSFVVESTNIASPVSGGVAVLDQSSFDWTILNPA